MKQLVEGQTVRWIQLANVLMNVCCCCLVCFRRPLSSVCCLLSVLVVRSRLGVEGQKKSLCRIQFANILMKRLVEGSPLVNAFQGGLRYRIVLLLMLVKQR